MMFFKEKKNGEKVGFALIAEGTTKTEAEKRLAEVRAKIDNPPKTLIPAAIPVLENEAEELEKYIALLNEE